VYDLQFWVLLMIIWTPEHRVKQVVVLDHDLRWFDCMDKRWELSDGVPLNNGHTGESASIECVIGGWTA
jgi:hypothetical protein